MSIVTIKQNIFSKIGWAALKKRYQQLEQGKENIVKRVLVAKAKFSQQQHEQRLTDCLEALETAL
ncbi:MAG: hypothetical protein Q9M19_03745 [Mariprofundaceae bacterium]|nr:hypothetical protein [Mariprofundaceae bacterium]